MKKKKIVIFPVSKINGEINLPGSKSISNRVLLLSSLSEGKTVLKNFLFSEDTKYMLEAFKKIGIPLNINKKKKTLKILGSKNFFKNKKTALFLGNAGTAIRPLTAIFSLYKNNVELNGNARMNCRPIKHLVNSLIEGGADIYYKNINGYPPIIIKGGFSGGKIFIDGKISSQFLTSLLIACPLAKNNTEIFIKNDLVSKPYVDLTIRIIRKFGIKIINNNYSYFNISGNQNYISPKKFLIEGDASSASYFFAAAAIKGGEIKVRGIGENSIQGDIKFLKILKKMGAIVRTKNNTISVKRKTLKCINLDMNNMPDVAMTVAILGLFSNGQTVIKNIYNWRVKESDRLSAMSTELKKVGAIVEEGIDFIKIIPPKKFISSIINTYDDHRIAMCFSLVALSGVKITILNPECVKKTFPKYFKKFFSVISFKTE
ncbi:3-phosphoshikimate 1-carboxyvinyltransferase [Buchnera aphidicola (Ceratoglyphina bambusae)]|uniref:3-phosphoshikimate 1-carboxyvinyltransferase n=1 Tax=Buchnera aphidicola TaxID=9 RepID=UPI0031B8090E